MDIMLVVLLLMDKILHHCTTKDDMYPIIYRVLTIPGGAGSLPSTVCQGVIKRDPFFGGDQAMQIFRG